MDFEKVLEKCGNYGRYQFILLLLYGYTNFMSSMHYFSQTLITFTPDHWCYHEQLENNTFSEIDAIYQGFSKPHCTLLEESDNGTTLVQAEVGVCRKWFYNKENNYESITTEVSKSKTLFFSIFLFNFLLKILQKINFLSFFFFIFSLTGFVTRLICLR